jgi:DNA polymerase III subunit delta'
LASDTHSNNNNWDRVIGQTRVKEILRASIRNNRLAHAYLFWGNEGVGKDALAIEFARTLLCLQHSDIACCECSSCKKIEQLQHPNLKLIFPLPGGDTKKDDGDDNELDKDVVEEVRNQISQKAANPYFHISIPRANSIRIKSIRELKKESSMSGVEKGKKVFIIFDADMLNEASANSLLKVLEEPLPETHFILVSSRKDQVKQTILSRSQLVQCSTLSDDDISNALIQREGIEEQQAIFLTRLANGSYSKAIEFHSDDMNQYRIDAIQFLRGILGTSTIKFSEDFEEYLLPSRRSEAEQLLLMLLVWFRDACIAKERGFIGVMNIDLEKDLLNFNAKFGEQNLMNCQLSVERALELLRRNVYLPLVMLSLSVNLKRILYNGK